MIVLSKRRLPIIVGVSIPAPGANIEELENYELLKNGNDSLLNERNKGSAAKVADLESELAMVKESAPKLWRLVLPTPLPLPPWRGVCGLSL
jgi:hypothetical protein